MGCEEKKPMSRCQPLIYLPTGFIVYLSRFEKVRGSACYLTSFTGTEGRMAALNSSELLVCSSSASEITA